jgi:hypothetical protein
MLIILTDPRDGTPIAIRPDMIISAKVLSAETGSTVITLLAGRELTSVAVKETVDDIMRTVNTLEKESNV